MPEPESKTCPKCRLTNVYTAEHCDCGYDFITNTISAKDEQNIMQDRKLQWLPYVLGFVITFLMQLLAGNGIAFALGSCLIPGLLIGAISLGMYHMLKKKMKAKSTAMAYIIVITLSILYLIVFVRQLGF